MSDDLLVYEAEKPDILVVISDSDGNPGAPGAAGEGPTFVGLAGETIHGDRAVVAIDGLLYHPDTSLVEHASQVVGIATQSASLGGSCVVRTAGMMTIAGSWISGIMVFCADEGVLTQSPGATGWLMPVGKAASSTMVQVSLQRPILR